MFVLAAFLLLMTQQLIDHQFRARIRLVDTRELPEMPEGIDEPFVFVTESSNNQLDWYYTHMTERTLRNFAEDATAGVQFLDSHNAGNLGYGRTFNGRVETVPNMRPDFTLPNPNLSLAITPPTEYMRVLLSTYTVPGIRFGGGLTYASTDDFIRAARAQIAKDISVGFGGGDWICDICGGNYRRYSECPHIAGMEYPMGDQGERMVVATVSIDEARLLEHSVVYDGACPDAMVVKANRAARAGDLEPEQKRSFENRYKVALPERIVSPGITLGNGKVRTAGPALDESNGRLAEENQEGGNRMPIENEQPVEGGEDTRALQVEFERLQTAVADIRGVLAGVEGVPVDASDIEAVRWLVGQVNELRVPAADGRQYRTDLIAEALAEGIRALGEHFDEEAYRNMLGGLSLDGIKRMRGDWQRTAAMRFQPGRSVNDENDPPQPQKDERKNGRVPDVAYEA